MIEKIGRVGSEGSNHLTHLTSLISPKIMSWALIFLATISKRYAEFRTSMCRVGHSHGRGPGRPGGGGDFSRYDDMHVKPS